MSGGSGASPAPADNDDIRLRVESISGQVLHLRVPRTETVLGLKNRIFSKQGIPVAEQNLMFLEEELKDFHTLEDYNIKDSCTVRLSVGMKGGPINSRRTLYLDDKNTITEMAKILAVNDISVVLVPHNGAYHIIPVPSPKRDTDASSSSRERRRVSSLSTRLMYAGATSSGDPGSVQSGEGMNDRRYEENKATKIKMTALQKQLKEKRSAPPGTAQAERSTLLCCSSLGSCNSSCPSAAQIAPALISRQSGQCCASNLQKTILSDAMPPAAASSVLVGGGGSGAEAPRKVVVPRLIAGHNTISLNVKELTSAQSLASYACATASGAGDGGGAFESSSSYSSGVERNLVLYPSAGPSGSASNSQGGEAIFVSPYKGLFRCTADTTENASKEDVSSGTGRCSSAAAAPPPTDNSPTVVERPPAVGATQQQGGQGPASSAGSPPPSSSGLGAAKAQLLPSQTSPSVGTQPTPNKNHTQQPQQAHDDVTSAKEDVKAERPNEEACTPAAVGGQAGAAPSDTGAAKAVPGSVPPITAPPKKKHPRCAVCNKKTGLASSYTCRCGGNFCATHRYAEAHDCGHDYKTEGRQLLEKSNPLIQAVKLQKI